MADESNDLMFPLGGTWLVGEFGEQPPLTTPSGVNVRGQDPFEQRLRGGSRRGTSKLMPGRVAGNHPIQCLDFVVTTDPSASLFAFDQSDEGPGIRIADPSTSNFPNGPGPTGPGGNAQGGPFGPPDFNRRQPAAPNNHTVRQGGNGVMRLRTAAPVVPPVVPPPPPPSPPAVPVTRTYFPFAGFEGGEGLPRFSVGPFALPLTPPTDLDPTVIVAGADPCGAAMTIDLATWGGTSLPTVADVNALVLSHGCTYGGHPGGPYETSTDS